MQLSIPGLSLRTIQQEDDAVLYTIYASTREPEMQHVPHWSEEQKKAFLLQQFTAQHTFYQKQYVGAHFCLILKEGTAIGRLYLAQDYSDGTIRIMDITLLPAWRKKGYGKAILQEVMKLAVAKQKNITIHVESFNPAMRLYERLGFTLKDRKNEVYHLLEWQCAENVLPA